MTDIDLNSTFINGKPIRDCTREDLEAEIARSEARIREHKKAKRKAEADLALLQQQS